jgi:hypothetical protein
VLLSVYVPCACICAPSPSATVVSAGVTSSDTSSAGVTSAIAASDWMPFWVATIEADQFRRPRTCPGDTIAAIVESELVQAEVAVICRLSPFS